MAEKTLDWRRLFSKSTLAKGKQYFDSGKAKRIQEEENGYTATVRGSRNYRVRITGWDEDIDSIRSLECSCPYAREGNLCKHMSAALFLIEREYCPMYITRDDLARLTGKAENNTAVSAQETSQASSPASSQVPSQASSGKKVSGKQRQRKKAAPERKPQEPSSAFPEQYSVSAPIAELRRQERERMEQDEKEAQEQAAASGETLRPATRHMEPYRHFHYEKYESNLKITDAMRKAAKRLLDKNELTDVQVHIGYPRRTPWDKNKELYNLHGFAEARFDNGYSGVQIVFDADHILESRCSYWKCYASADYDPSAKKKMSFCEHRLALLTCAMEYLEKNNPGDATSLGGHNLLGSADRGQYLLTGADDFNAPSIQIEPVIEYGEYEEDCIPTVSFQTGTSRLYKVKKIREYVDAMRAGDEMKFGTKTMIRLGEGLLDPDAQTWYRFMQDALREEEQRNRALGAGVGGSYYGGSSYQVGAQIVDAIPLYGASLDKFFRAAEGKEISFSIREERGGYYGGRNGKRKAKLTFCTHQLQVQIEVSPMFHLQLEDESPVTAGGNYSQDEPFLGIRITGQLPALIEGQDASYFVDEEGGRFCRVDRAQIEKIEPLLAAVEDEGRIDARIGRRNLREFYDKMMPRLREAVDVVEYGRDIIESYLPPEPEFFFYFDIEEGLILCRPDVHYGMQIHTILDLLPDAPWSGPVASYRDQEKEGRALEILHKYLPAVEPELRVTMILREDEEGLFQLLSVGLEELMNIGEVRMTEAFRRLGLRRHMKFSVGVSVESNLMDLQIQTEDLSEEELLAVFYQYQKKRKFVRLKNGDFLQLDKNETIERLLEIMETMGVSLKEFVRGRMQVPAYRALYLDKMLEQMQDVYTDRDRHFKALIKEFKTVEDADFEVPAPLRGTLRKYQIAGYRWLRTLDHYGFGGILADEMGLGKTLQVIAVLLANWKSADEENTARTSLVVCPASLVYNWGEELRRFAPQLSACLVTGTKRERALLIEDSSSYDVLVTSYDLLKRDIDLYEGKDFRFEIIDEAQYIKNHRTAAAKSVKLVRAQTRFALTGTPIENRLSELWSIFDYLMPGFLYTYAHFSTELETPIVKYQDEAAAERLRRMATPFILRRRKQDVLRDLPEKLEEVRFAGMAAKQRKLYDGQVVRMKSDMREKSESDFRKSRIQILAELTRIRQICCDPSLILENYDGASAKREACMDLIRTVIEGEHKALIFSQFAAMLELLEEDLKKEDIVYYKITGATPKEKRIEMVKAFNSDRTPVFLISLKAGGTGLNLTGADVVIHYDPWWNVAAQNQATDRAHRIGQTRIVTVYKLIVKDTIEERILEMQENKEKLAEDILSSESISSSAISREDLLELLG